MGANWWTDQARRTRPPESERSSSGQWGPWSEPWAASRRTSSASVRAARRGRTSGYARSRPRSPAGRSPAAPSLGGRTVVIFTLGFRFGRLARNDAIDSHALGLLGFEHEAELLAHHRCEEAAHRVLLPAGRLHDRGDCRPFGLAQQRNHGCLLGGRARWRDAGRFRVESLCCRPLTGRPSLAGLADLAAWHVGILSSLRRHLAPSPPKPRRGGIAGGAGSPARATTPPRPHTSALLARE